MSALMILFSMGSSVSAQQFDQSYLKWKAEQEAQDAKLKKVDDRYYLSRPSVAHSSSKNNASKNKASNSSAQNTANAGMKISLNNASLTELQQLNGVGERKAQAIVQYRQQNGKFKSIDELQNVKGIGPKLLEKNKAKLSL
ncbi:transporter [Acinetobacter sp. TGL-Y2]|uniref:ComEA family DNA-binding protein n=1 Tax=Acinetobacter sp. TGL-Y2 TaxID=1407071 RepID=UPI0007A65F02|nr:ComEA family DNA-binding protein [Acinetobacter sp. TGL-Y2]AMW77901.1 transporter [Acinetobacter sp. TGL-Y2]